MVFMKGVNNFSTIMPIYLFYWENDINIHYLKNITFLRSLTILFSKCMYFEKKL